LIRKRLMEGVLGKRSRRRELLLWGDGPVGWVRVEV